MLYAVAPLDGSPEGNKPSAAATTERQAGNEDTSHQGQPPQRRFLRQDSFTPQQTVDIPKEERKLSRDGKQAFQRWNESGTNDDDRSTVGELLMQRT